MIRADLLAESAPVADGREPWSREAFEAQLRENGKSYHIFHAFNVMLNTGKASSTTTVLSMAFPMARSRWTRAASRPGFASVWPWA